MQSVGFSLQLARHQYLPELTPDPNFCSCRHAKKSPVSGCADFGGFFLADLIAWVIAQVLWAF